MDFLKELQGYKTYILTAAAFVAIVLYSQGIFDRESLGMILSILGFGSVAALRSGVKKLEK